MSLIYYPWVVVRCYWKIVLCVTALGIDWVHLSTVEEEPVTIISLIYGISKEKKKIENV